MGKARLAWVGMRRTSSLRFWCLALAAASLTAACGDAEPGSQEELRAQLDAIDLPAGMEELDDSYVSSSPAPRPALVVWYQVTRPLEEIRVELLGAIEEAGWDVREGAENFDLWSARNAEHILFVVLDPSMIARNQYAPEGTNAEISVMQLDKPPG